MCRSKLLHFAGKSAKIIFNRNQRGDGMENTRSELLKKLWAAQDEAYDLMAEYDSLPHHYGEMVLYQAEAYIVGWIGRIPDITTSELAARLKKTPSACSQIIRKLIDKGLVIQTRNPQNKRVYNLRLTETGEQVHRDHVAFNEHCQSITFRMLQEFSEEELAAHLRVQERINQAYRSDVARSRERYGE